MAKAKKEKLSLEELLEQALIKEEDRPYEVPENWVWTYMGNAAKLHRGVSYNKNEVTKQKNENSCLVLRGGNVIEERLIFDDNVYVDKSIIKENQFLKKSDIIIVSSTGSTKVIGRAGISDYDYDDVAFGAFLTLVRPIDNIDKKYVALFFQTDDYRNVIRKLAKGVNINNIKNEYIENIQFPLPPISEQHRIVKTINSLFEKLDKAKELVQSALDSFENRKAAILNKAFTGELTAKWREENGVSMDEWQKKKFGQIATVKSNLVDPKDYLDFPHIAPDNIEKRTGKLLEYRTIKEDKVQSSKHKFYPGQILYSKIRPYLSKVVIIDFEGLCSADMYPIETELNTKYLWYYMLSDYFVMLASSAGSRSVLPKINQKELGELPTIVPSFHEQNEIVRILDNILENEQRAKELCDVIEKIDLMKKAILARAFRGELGTNNPDEENAIELLKEVLKEKGGEV